MIPQPITIDGEVCYDIGWGVIKPSRNNATNDELYMKPLEDMAREYAVCYIATETGKCQGIYYVMTIDEAQRFVMDKRTQGVSRGHRWAYFYTSLFNFIQRGGIQEARFTHDTGKMDKVLKDLGIKPMSRTQITGLLCKMRYAYPEDIRGLMPGVIYEIDGEKVDIDIQYPRDMTNAVIELGNKGKKTKTAICAGWINMNSNLAVDAIWSRWISIKYDNKYR